MGVVGHKGYEYSYPLSLPLRVPEEKGIDFRELWVVNQVWKTLLKLIGWILMLAFPVFALGAHVFIIASGDFNLWWVAAKVTLNLIALGVILSAWGIFRREFMRKFKKSTPAGVWERDVLIPYIRQFPVQRFVLSGVSPYKSKSRRGKGMLAFFLPDFYAVEGAIICIEGDIREDNAVTKGYVEGRLYPKGVLLHPDIEGFGCDFVCYSPTGGSSIG